MESRVRWWNRTLPPESEVKGTRNVYLTVYRSTPPNERLEIEEGMDAGVARILLDVKGFHSGNGMRRRKIWRGSCWGWKVPEATPSARMTGFRRAQLGAGHRRAQGAAGRLAGPRGTAFADAVRAVEDAGLLPGRWRWSRPATDGMDTLRAVVSSQIPRVCAGPSSAGRI